MIKRTYIDASILIAAFQGDENTSRRAMEILDDPFRSLVVSDFVRLEVLPKPMFYKRLEEIEFMQAVLDNAAENVETSPELTKRAVDLASKYNMTPIDAIHVSAAVAAKVDELVTLEKDTKPMCQVREIKVVSLHSTRIESQ